MNEAFSITYVRTFLARNVTHQTGERGLLAILTYRTFNEGLAL